MTEINISGLENATIQRLQRRAESHGWTVQDEIRHILTCGLDALEYAEKAFRELKEKGDKVSQLINELDSTALRTKVEQMLKDGRERDAQLLRQMDEDIEEVKAMIGNSIPKAISQSSLISIIEAVVDEKVKAGEMFTAHDVTLEVRKRGHRADHNEVRDAVHDYYARGGLGVAYTRTNISVPGGQPLLYHRTVDDPSTYLNIRDGGRREKH
jgi:plasmid stability protein